MAITTMKYLHSSRGIIFFKITQVFDNILIELVCLETPSPKQFQCSKQTAKLKSNGHSASLFQQISASNNSDNENAGYDFNLTELTEDFARLLLLR